MPKATGTRAITVAIVDDHDVVLSGVRTTIQDDASLELVGEARNAREAWRIARCRAPRVMLVDVNLGKGGPSGLTLTDALGTYYPAVRVIMLSVDQGSGHTRSAHRAGARGYVSKADPSDRIIQAVHAVADDGSFWQNFSISTEEEHWPTNTEAKVMRILVSKGKGHNKDVAGVLGIAVSTAEAHRLNIRRKLGLDTPVEMYRWLAEHGRLEDDDLGDSCGSELGARLEAELAAELRGPAAT